MSFAHKLSQVIDRPWKSPGFGIPFAVPILSAPNHGSPFSYPEVTYPVFGIQAITALRRGTWISLAVIVLALVQRCKRMGVVFTSQPRLGFGTLLVLRGLLQLTLFLNLQELKVVQLLALDCVAGCDLRYLWLQHFLLVLKSGHFCPMRSLQCLMLSLCLDCNLI